MISGTCCPVAESGLLPIGSPPPPVRLLFRGIYGVYVVCIGLADGCRGGGKTGPPLLVGGGSNALEVGVPGGDVTGGKLETDVVGEDAVEDAGVAELEGVGEIGARLGIVSG